MKTIFLSFLFLLAPFFALADGSVVINEIAWMGTKESSNNEWIELANISQNEADITGWKLETQDGKMKITLAGNIPAGGFFLLERTDDKTVSEIKADQIYAGSLSNKGEALILKDKNGIEIDRVDASNGWPAGDNTTKQTMQRSKDVWITGEGTPRATNIAPKSEILNPKSQINSNDQISNNQTTEKVSIQNPPNVQIEKPVIQESSVKSEAIILAVKEYPKSVYISEFMPDPLGSDEKGEWIELYNNSESSADIGGFFLDDADGGSNPYKILESTAISPKGFTVFNRLDTKIALNNKKDEVRLLYPDKTIAAKVSYEDAKEGMAGAYDIAKKLLYWTKIPTPGKDNIIEQEMEKGTNSMMSKIRNVEAGRYQDGKVATLEDLPPLNLKELGGDNKSLAANAGNLRGYSEDFWIILLALCIGIGATFGYIKFIKKAQFIFIAGLFFFIPFFAFAEVFNVSQDYNNKSQIDAESITSGKWSVIYLEKGLNVPSGSLERIEKEFDERIYPNLTAFLGEPWKPGIDNDSRITILISKMPQGIGGYYNGDDELPKTVNATSNEREMLYLNSDYAGSKKMYAFLAHELQHLIAYNQKVREIGREEDVWLNELRSEYAPTFLGYDTNFQGSNLEERVDDFIKEPFDHLVNWGNSRYDYAAVNMFGQYMFSRFGSQFFSKEIHTNKIGEASVEEVLIGLDTSLSFAKFFAQWRLTNYVNDTDILGGKYSYKNPNITFTFTPELTFNLDSAHTTQTTKNHIPTFSSKAISFSLDNVRANVEVSADTPSSDLVVTYTKKLADGTFNDGQLSLEKGSGQIIFDENVRSATIVLSNASKEIINPTFTVKANAKKISHPLLKGIESAFLTPTIEDNVFLVKGEDFNEGLELYSNGNKKGFIRQNNSALLIRISPNEGREIVLRVHNLDGSEASLQWENPLVPSQNITEGSLMRALGDYKVYEILRNGKKQWIKTKKEFIKRKLNWNAILKVNKKEFDLYPAI